MISYPFSIILLFHQRPVRLFYTLIPCSPSHSRSVVHVCSHLATMIWQTHEIRLVVRVLCFVQREWSWRRSTSSLLNREVRCRQVLMMRRLWCVVPFCTCFCQQQQRKLIEHVTILWEMLRNDGWWDDERWAMRSFPKHNLPCWNTSNPSILLPSPTPFLFL